MMTSTMTVRRLPLLGALAGLTPHLPAKLDDTAEDTGAGLARLTTADMTLLALAVSKAAHTAVAIATTLSEVSDDEAPDVWLPKTSLDAVVGMLRASSSIDVELEVTDQALTVHEAGILWGGRSVTVPNLPEPSSPNRYDAARMLLRAAGSYAAVSISVPLWASDVARMGKTADAVGQALVCHLGRAGEEHVVLWGYEPSRGFDEYDQPEEVPGSRYLATTSAPWRTFGALNYLERQCYAGPLLPMLMDVAMPDLSTSSTEQDERDLVHAVEDFLSDTSQETN